MKGYWGPSVSPEFRISMKISWESFVRWRWAHSSNWIPFSVIFSERKTRCGLINHWNFWPNSGIFIYMCAILMPLIRANWQQSRIEGFQRRIYTECIGKGACDKQPRYRFFPIPETASWKQSDAVWVAFCPLVNEWIRTSHTKIF